jgi:Sulfotransferase family
MTLLSQYDALHEQAIKATGLEDFGPADYVEPMKLLLSTYDKRGNLNELGQQMTSGAVTGFLIARLLAHQGFKDHPQFADAKVDKPLIIVVMPRTGSTALHRLLAKDPGVQWLTPWLANTPMPRPPRDTWESNPMYQMTVQGLEQFYQLFPWVAGMHPIRPAEPDECHFIVAHTFWSPPMVGLGAIGEYSDWLVNFDGRGIYPYHRNLLGLIAGGDKRRWLLKDPTTHPFILPALLDTYPDACFVYTHRDPVIAMSSVSSMVYSIRKEREPGLTPEQNGRDQLWLWGVAARKMETTLNTLPRERVFDLHVRELEADPVGSAENIYRHFNIPVTEAARAAWAHHANTDARSGHGGHHYKIDNCGFSASDVYDCVGVYGEKYKSRYG